MHFKTLLAIRKREVIERVKEDEWSDSMMGVTLKEIEAERLLVAPPAIKRATRVLGCNGQTS